MVQYFGGCGGPNDATASESSARSSDYLPLSTSAACFFLRPRIRSAYPALTRRDPTPSFQRRPAPSHHPPVDSHWQSFDSDTALVRRGTHPLVARCLPSSRHCTASTFDAFQQRGQVGWLAPPPPRSFPERSRYFRHPPISRSNYPKHGEEINVCQSLTKAIIFH